MMKPVSLIAFLVLVLPLVLGSCAPETPAQSGQAPVIEVFNADPLSIAAGESSTLNWSIANAVTAEIDQGIGNVGLSGDRMVSPTVSTTYTLTAISPTGAKVTATTSVVVKGATPPVIVAFSANPLEIASGGAATLTWEVEGATSVNIEPGVGSVASSGNTSVTPTMETTYTLTATGAGGSASSIAKVKVSGGAPSGPPVINSFVADPPSIHPGQWTTLRWDVSNVSSVTLDRGIGSKPAVSSHDVSVLATTNYTLTAANSHGTVSEVLMVVVTEVPEDALPDLIVTGISKVEAATGHIISYTVKNQDSASAGPSTARLYVDGVQKASDSVPTLLPGQSVTRQFASWRYDLNTPIVKVVVDADDDVEESNEGNNEKTVTFAVETVLDLVGAASRVGWQTGPPLTNIEFGEAESDARGFVVLKTNVRAEDGSICAKVLETHPKWVDGGWVQGFYPDKTIPLGARLVADVGFLNGATRSDGVIFRIWFWRDGTDIPNVLGTINATYDGELDHLNIDLASIKGQTGRIGIQVLAGGTSAQDWAIWTNAKIIR